MNADSFLTAIEVAKNITADLQRFLLTCSVCVVIFAAICMADKLMDVITKARDFWRSRRRPWSD